MAIEVRDGVEVKWCSRGKHYVAVDGFGPNRAKKSGLQDWCNDCIRDPNYFCSNCGVRRGDCKDYGGPLEVEFGGSKSHCKVCLIEYNKLRLKGGPNHKVLQASNSDRRARERGAEGQNTPEETDLLKFVYGETCPACHFRPVGHVDHVEPLNNPDKGWRGTNWVGNLQWLCPDCNITKSDRNDNDFRPDGGAAARAIERLELYKVRNSKHRRLYAGWIRRRLEVYETLEEKTDVLLALSVRDEIEVGILVKNLLAARAAEDVARAGTVRQG